MANRVPRETSEREDRARLREQAKFPLEIRRAASFLLGRRSVTRWGAADGGREVEVVVAEAITAVQGTGLVRETGLVERTDQERRGPIAGEDATRPIRAVGGRGESYGDQSCVRIAEPGNSAPPVGLVLKLALTFPSHLLAVPDEPRADRAHDHLPPDEFERIHSSGGTLALLR